MRVRFRAARAPYRRGGLVFVSTRDWVEIEPESLSDAANLALLGDPAIQIEVSVPGDDGPEWVKFSDEDRRLGAEILTVYRQATHDSEPAGEGVAIDLAPPPAPPPPPAPTPLPTPKADKPAPAPKAPKAAKAATGPKAAKATSSAKAPPQPEPAPSPAPGNTAPESQTPAPQGAHAPA